jgi:tetratricopeptide (TPR) repeat protein
MAEMDTPIILEQDQRLSRSGLWKLQRAFFEQQGISAWSENVIPTYITSNTFTANAYGKVVLGFLRDWYSVARNSLDMSQPVYIVELGSGSGHFSYHFLKKFLDFFTRSALKEIPIKYIMTEISEELVTFWQNHPSLQPFVEQGFLDFAIFDVEQPHEFTLRHSGAVLSSATIKNPLVLVANYLFDFISQDCFTLQRGQLHESLVTFSTSEPELDLGDPALFASLEVSYAHRGISADYYDDPDFNRVLRSYEQRLPDTTFTFPHVALSCLRFFRDLSGGRLLLLCGGEGYSQEEDLLDRGTPSIIMHGSCFSMMVNYHSIGEYVRNQGGLVLRMAHRYTNLYVSAYLLGQHPDDYLETAQSFHEAIESAGPDDFYMLKSSMEEMYNTLSLQQLLVYLRLSGWDSNIFLDCYSVLLEHLKEASKAEQHGLSQVAQHVWDTYYHIGEEQDLAFALGVMLYRMEYHSEALDFFLRSLELYGPDQSTFYNLAMCYSALRRIEEAVSCLDQALEVYPSFELAKTLRIKLQSQLNRKLPA